MTLANCVDIFKKSLLFGWENKRLWWVSFLIVFIGETINLLGGVVVDQQAQAELATFNLSFLTNAIKLINQNPKESLIFLLIVTLVLFVINAGLRSSLLVLIKTALKNEKSAFFEDIKSGFKSSLKIVQLDILSLLFILIALSILATPIAILLSKQATMAVWVLGIGALLIFTPLALITYLIWIFGQIYAIQHKLSVKESFRDAYVLLSNNFKASVLAFFTFNILVVTLMLSMVLLFSIISNIMFFAGHFAKDARMVDYSNLISSTIFLTVLRSFLVTSQQSMWVFFFEKISLRKDSPLKEQEVAEEIIAEKAI